MERDAMERRIESTRAEARTRLRVRRARERDEPSRRRRTRAAERGGDDRGARCATLATTIVV